MKKKILLILSFSFLIFGFQVNVNAKSVDNFANGYKYPIQPGTAEWENLTTTEQMISLSQVPENILETMDTDALVETVLDYPLLVNLFLFDTPQQGFNSVLNDSNALRELVAREDAREILLQKYSSMPNVQTPGLYDNTFRRMVLEFLLSQDIFKDNSLAPLSGDLYEVYTVTTPKGSLVVVWFYYDDFTGDEKTMLDYQVSQSYPNATRLRSATKFYNCHSYAWYSTSTGNHYWMNDPSKYMSDGSYSPITPAVGRVVYYKNEHSAIISSISGSNVYVTSKWGQLGLYRHLESYGPYHATRSYWKKN